jgi:uncharacterized ferritin-like protein (DUF455 family)
VPSTLTEFAHTVLEHGDLASKLAAPRGLDGRWLPDEQRGPATFIDRPARDDTLIMQRKAGRLPSLHALHERSARTLCFERFAHHELMAIELFAWALLAFPDAPDALRRGLAQALEEEQQHLQLYLDRLADEGGRLGEHPLSDYFWQVLPTRADDASLLGFLAGQGLTLEQANLDFTIHYQQGFAAVGDTKTAAVLQRVHEDEIGHVSLAWRWFVRLTEGRDPAAAYDEEVPFPLQASRAKGRRFARDARERAGLSPAFIDHIEHARPRHQLESA